VINSFDPFQNILGGTKYLRFLLDKFGDETLAIASYNAGFEKVILFNGIPPYRETQNYIQKVSNYKKVFMQKL
jgi:soluble lytic murein transglycosylase-like protein